MLNQYETVFIVTPVLSEEQMKEAVEKYRNLIREEGEIVVDDHWGLRKLAYPIQHKSTGFYHMFEFKADSSFVDRLETEYRRDERIIRFLTVRMDKYAIEYSEKKRAAKEGKSEAAEGEKTGDEVETETEEKKEE